MMWHIKEGDVSRQRIEHRTISLAPATPRVKARPLLVEGAQTVTVWGALGAHIVEGTLLAEDTPIVEAALLGGGKFFS